MSSSKSGTAVFRIKEHIIPCHHIREDVVRTSLHDGADWRMSVKQYTPLDNLEPAEGDVTILGAPALGFPKELYEPLWEELYHVLRKRGFKIRSIWIADPANLGLSAELNPDLIWDYSSPSNYARDLYNLTTHFPSEFTHPIIGIGHSIGATHLTQLSLLHPSLLTSLILLDPILVSSFVDGNAPFLSKFALKRPQVFPSRDLARMGFGRAFKKWDPRVFELFMRYGLSDRDGSDGQGEVEMVAGRYAEVGNYLTPSHMHSFHDVSEEGRGKKEEEEELEWCRTPVRAHILMPMIATPTLILAAGKSPTSKPSVLDDWRTNFGSNVLFRKPGEKRRVKVDVVEDGSHLFPFEDPEGVASRLESWIENAVGEHSVFAKERGSVKRWRTSAMKEKEKAVETWMEDVKSKL